MLQLYLIKSYYHLELARNNQFNVLVFVVLCAHNGYGFDFKILLSNMKRYGLKDSVLQKHNLHFADTFHFCKQVVLFKLSFIVSETSNQICLQATY